MTIKKKRSILGFSILINICSGFPYTWSVFAVYLAGHLDKELTELTLTFSIGALALNLMAIAGGRIQDVFGPAMAIRIGACFYCLGLFMCGFTSSVLWLYLFYGVIACSGMGLIYNAVLMNINNVFPEMRGTVSGISTASFGLHAVIFSPVAAYLVGVFGLLSTYKILGMAFFIVLVFSSFFMNKKPASGGIQPELSDAAKKDKSWIEMIRTPVFYIILLLMTIGATCGLLITSQASIMAQIMVGAGITEAAFAVSMFAGANTAGRFIWGVLSDKMGRINALYCIFLFTALSMLGLSFVRGEQFVFFVFLIAMIAFCYGGIMGTFPALVTEHFGNKSNGANYGLVLQGVSVGGFIGPLIAAFTQTVTPGDFNFAFYIAAALSTLGLILVFMLKKFS